MRNSARLPFFLAIALCTPACFPALLGVGAGLVMSHDVLDNNTYVTYLDEEASLTWAIAKSSLTHKASSPITVNDDLRTAVGTVDGASVTISVEVYDNNRCRLMVSAHKLGLSNRGAADAMLQQVVADLHEVRG